MDIKIIAKMLKDKHFADHQKMKNIYGEDFNAF